MYTEHFDFTNSIQKLYRLHPCALGSIIIQYHKYRIIIDYTVTPQRRHVSCQLGCVLALSLGKQAPFSAHFAAIE